MNSTLYHTHTASPLQTQASLGILHRPDAPTVPCRLNFTLEISPEKRTLTLNTEATRHMSKKKAPAKETFTCRFSDGTTICFTINLKNLQHILDTNFTSVPKPPVKKHLLPEYINWMHTVMSTLARHLGRAVPYCYPSGNPDLPLFYVYRPDGSYEEIPEG